MSFVLMTEFELPVNYNGKELLFPANLLQFGYSYKIEVVINGTKVSFERDEERNWRALVDAGTINANINSDFLTAIAKSLENL